MLVHGLFQEVKGQLQIISNEVSELLIGPLELNRSVLMVGSEEIETITFTSTLTDLNTNEKLIHTISNPISVRFGINTIVPDQNFFRSTEYSGSKLANYIKVQRRLPSGNYEHCLEVSSSDGEYYDDVKCEAIQIITNEFLDLIFPENFDTVKTLHPVLNWTTSGLHEMELGKKRFRLLLTEKKVDQNAESAINSNPAIFLIENARSFSIPYPAGAAKLEQGKTYAWRIECQLDGEVVDQTETWEFTVWQDEPKESLKYAVLRDKWQGKPYDVVDGKIFFTFSERYFGSVDFPNYAIFNSLGERMDMPISHDEIPASEDQNRIDSDRKFEDEGSQSGGYQATGTTQGRNQFLLDVSSYNLEPGVYTLVVRNFKDEPSTILFTIPTL